MDRSSISKGRTKRLKLNGENVIKGQFAKDFVLILHLYEVGVLCEHSHLTRCVLMKGYYHDILTQEDQVPLKIITDCAFQSFNLKALARCRLKCILQNGRGNFRIKSIYRKTNRPFGIARSFSFHHNFWLHRTSCVKVQLTLLAQGASTMGW